MYIFVFYCNFKASLDLSKERCRNLILSLEGKTGRHQNVLSSIAEISFGGWTLEKCALGKTIWDTQWGTRTCTHTCTHIHTLQSHSKLGPCIAAVCPGKRCWELQSIHVLSSLAPSLSNPLCAFPDFSSKFFEQIFSAILSSFFEQISLVLGGP